MMATTKTPQPMWFIIDNILQTKNPVQTIC